jgi:hypothetical protein
MLCVTKNGSSNPVCKSKINHQAVIMTHTNESKRFKHIYYFPQRLRQDFVSQLNRINFMKQSNPFAFFHSTSIASRTFWTLADFPLPYLKTIWPTGIVLV